MHRRCFAPAASPVGGFGGRRQLGRAAERRLVGRTGWPRAVMQTLKAGVPYFVLVFGAGFLLGPIRVFWVVPHLGERTAELVEMPIMLGVMMVAAQWIVRRLAVPPTRSSRLGMGGVALGLLLAAE